MLSLHGLRIRQAEQRDRLKLLPGQVQPVIPDNGAVLIIRCTGVRAGNRLKVRARARARGMDRDGREAND